MDGIIHNSDTLFKNGKKEDGTVKRTEMVPPDGGWGWVILMGNCILMFLLPTSPVCYGVVYLALVQQEGISNTVASGITAVLLGTATFLGPVSTLMSSFYSHRKLALVGVALMSVGLLFCSLSLNIIWLYFSFLLIGFGNSLATPQIFLIGQEYFAQKRVTANAIASAAYTAGYVVLPIILLNLISSYSIRGAFLVWAAIMLNGLVGAMLYQPIEKHAKLKQVYASPAVTFSEKIHTIEDGVENRAGHDLYENGYIEYKNKNGEPNGYVHDSVNNLEENNTTTFRDVHNLNSCQKPNDADSLQSINEEDNFKELNFTEFQISPLTADQILLRDANDERPSSFISTTSIDSYYTVKTNFKSMVSVAPSEYFDVMGSLVSMQSIEESKPLNSVIDVSNPDLTVSREEIPTRKQTPPKRSHRICGISLPYFSDIVKLEVLTSPVFLIIAVSSAVYRQVYYGYSSFLPIVAQIKHSENSIPFLLLVLAGAEITSKFCTGFIADRGWITSRNLYMGSTLVNCFALILTGFSKNLMVLTAATIILGLGLGVCSSLGPVLLVKYHSLKLLPHSYGLMLFLSGAATFVLLPIQGWTIDATGSANYVCYIFASLCLVPLILWSLMPIAEKYSNANTKRDG